MKFIYQLRKCFLLSLIIFLFFSLYPLDNAIAKLSINEVINQVSDSVVQVVSSTIPSNYYVSPLPLKGTGSGFIFDKQGHVVTVESALGDKHSLEIILKNGDSWPARLKGLDPETGIAVLEIKAPAHALSELKPISFRSTANLKPGQWLIAVGSPYWLAAGMLSAIRKGVTTSEGGLISPVLQTDISIHRGLAGGPLVDSGGRLVGQNTLLFTERKQIPGIGYAISSETVKWIAQNIIEKGYVSGSWLGVTLQAISPALARLLSVPVMHGAMIVSVVPGSPADKAGLKGCLREFRIGNRTYKAGGDIIVAVDGRTVNSDLDLIRYLRTKEAGDTIKLTVYQNDRIQYVTVTLAERPAHANH